MSSWVNQTSTEEAPLADYGVAAVGFIGVDLVGAYVLCGAVAVLVLYLVFCFVDKWKKSRGKMNSVAAGMLRLAAARGDVEAMELLLSNVPHFNPDAAMEGFTALHAAAVEGHADAVTWLCTRGADVAALKQDEWHDTALHYAASRGHMKVVQVLLAFKADPAAKNFSGATPADLAARQKHTAVARYLGEVASGKVAPPQPEELTKALTERLGSGENKLKGGNSKSRVRTLKEVAGRGWEGVGSQGTELKHTVKLFRVFAVITQFLNVCYLIWRALRSLRPGWYYFYSIPFWILEFCPFVLSNSFMMSMWNQIERPERDMYDMLPGKDLPHVDVFIVTYSEPVEIVEPTAIAALNMHWPGDKLTVNILDDGKRESIQKMVKKLQFQMKYMHRDASIVYIGREKRKGVPHHAKAGNINSAILKEGPGKGMFIMVLDCDMIVHPDFLTRTLGHFYRQEEEGGRWVLKEKAAFIQTPQDFWNVDAADPMVHCARFFYGPMLQGRDGIGACPCCGTGVVFRRDILTSIGGQAYGSITEDYNTAMHLQSSGFATMFLNERLVYGMAPDEIEAVFTQRLRWAMGALQILMRSNPLRLVGLTWAQAFLFYEAAAHHMLAIATIAFAVAPIVYLFTEVSPMVCEHLWEFTAVFGSWYLSNRIAMWWVHRGCMGGDQELWRGSQMWVWMSPNHLKAIWKVLVAETWICKCFRFEIGFAVTSKEKQQETAWAAMKRGLAVTWPFLLYYAAYFAGLSYFIITASMGWYTAWQITIFLAALGWGALICLCIWPPVATLFPRVETDMGWKIVWDAFLDPTMFAQRRRSKDDLAASMRLSARLDSGGAGGSSTPSKAAVVQAGKSDPQLQAIAESVSSDEDQSNNSSSAPSKGPSPAAQPATTSSSSVPSTAKGAMYRSVTIQNTPASPPAMPVSGTASLASVQSPGLPSSGVASEELDVPVPEAPAAAASAAAAAPAQAGGSLSPFLSLQQRAASTGAPAAPAAASGAVSPFFMMRQATDARPTAAATSAPTTAAPSPATTADASGQDTMAAPSGQEATAVPLGPVQGSTGPAAAAKGGVATSAQHTGAGLSSGASRRLPGLFSSMLSSMLPWQGSGSGEHTRELKSEARSNIGRVGMPEQTARALAASALLTSVVLPERPPMPEPSQAGLSNGGSGAGVGSQEQPLLIGLEGDKVVPAEQALAAGASINLSALMSTKLDQPSWMGGMQASRPQVGGAALDLSKEETTLAADFATLTGALPSALLGSFTGAQGMGLGSIALGPGRPSVALPAIEEDVEAGQRQGGAARQQPVLAMPSANLGGMRALPSLALHSRVQHSLQLQTRPPANATAEERVAWASQQLRTLASMVSLIPGASLGPAPSLAGGVSTMVVPVVPSTIFDHTLAARPNFDRKSTPESNYMFLLVNGLLIGAMVAGSVLEVKVKVTGGDHSFSNLS